MTPISSRKARRKSSRKKLRSIVAFGGAALVQALPIDDANVDHTLVEGAEANMDAGRGILPLRTKWRSTGNGDGAQIPHIDAGAGQPADQGALEHARAAVRVAVDGDEAAFGQRGAQRGAQFGGKLRRQIDVDHAGDAKAAKRASAGPGCPR